MKTANTLLQENCSEIIRLIRDNIHYIGLSAEQQLDYIRKEITRLEEELGDNSYFS